MRNRTLADLDRVVALGGGHGLGRVLSLAFFIRFTPDRYCYYHG
ncbi:protein YbhK [Salmonella enterica subsp. arizonae]|uniref:Protein YbhK n=1 Tax=Salmonella enterica subsp. arizonae TaxID=59203 RepID=A0A379TDH8_SALER|nr:protein YbhK [Salmonella enterica subsp. arizonae]